jgi:hypothetical protein
MIPLPPSLLRRAEYYYALYSLGAESGRERIERSLLHALLGDGSLCETVVNRVARIAVRGNKLGRERRLEIVYDDTGVVGDVEPVVADLLYPIIDE